MGILFTANQVDESVATQTITAQDVGTSNLTGANGQVFYFGTTTTGSAASFTIETVETVNLQSSLLGAGGTLVVEVSMDGGALWFRPNVLQISTQSYSNSFTAPFAVSVPTSGLTNIRVRAISSWSGTATILAVDSPNPRGIFISDSLPGGANNVGSITNVTGTVSLPTGASTAAKQPALGTAGSSSADVITVQGIASGTALPISAASLPLPSGAATSALQNTGITSLSSIDGKLNSLGQKTSAASVPVVIASDQIITVTNNILTRTTYSAAITGLVSAALATDVFTISGSGTKTIKVTKISIDGLAAAGGNFTVQLIKRSTANSAGTSTTLTDVPHDSTDAAATATVKAYTVNPTLGTAVGTVRSNRVFISGVSTTSSVEDIQNFGDLGQEIILRGTTESLCMNLGATTITTPSLNIWVEWVEV